LIFFHCREVAEAYLKDQVTGVVISVPDQFGTLRRHSITAAARLAGLNVLRIVQDTALIGFNHIISHPISTSPLQNILILSVGSSYTNAAIASRKDGILEMQAVTGLSIGGNDFDARVFSHILGDFMMRTGKGLSKIS
jgi:molecular chaperone DnaK (HSP70)